MNCIHPLLLLRREGNEQNKRDLAEMSRRLKEYVDNGREVGHCEVGARARVGEALIISEPQIRFAVPIKGIHYLGYLDEWGPAEHELPPSKPLPEIDEKLKRIQQAWVSLVVEGKG
jgi:hypothetical protein